MPRPRSCAASPLSKRFYPGEPATSRCCRSNRPGPAPFSSHTMRCCLNRRRRSDPEKDKKAVKFDTISFDEVYKRKLEVMDLTAFTLCKENNIPIIVFDMNKSGNLKKVVMGEKIGTLVKL